jgi:hypothetical protein
MPDDDNVIRFPKILDAFETERRAHGVSEEYMEFLRPYRLVGHNTVRCESVEEWANVFNERYIIANRTGNDPWRVAETSIGIGKVYVWVSTVFLGIDHRMMASGPPILFETMVFGDKNTEYRNRCSTWEEAEKMHAEAVSTIRKALNAG